MNPSTAFATTFVDELARCGLAEAVLAPGSRRDRLRCTGPGTVPAVPAADAQARQARERQ